MSKRQSVWVIGLFIFTLFTGLLVNTPLQHVLKIVQLPPEIKMSGVHGTLLGGSVKSLVYKNFQLLDVDYDFQPGCLFKLSLCYELTSVDKELFLDIGLSLITQNVSVTKGSILIDSEVFKEFPGLLAQPKGQFLVIVDQLLLVNSKISDLEAQVDWLDAGIQGEEQLLGNYHAQLSKEKENLSIQIKDNNSLLSVTGDIGIKWNGQYNINLNFETRPSLNKSVISVLQMATKKSGLNRFTLKKTEKLNAKGLEILRIFDVEN